MTNDPRAARPFPTASEVFPDEGRRRAAAAAERGDVAGLRALGGVDLDDAEDAGLNLLMYEIAARNEVAVRALLEAGADPNALSPEGRSPMLVAGATGERRWVDLLLDNGGDPNLKNQFGDPLLPLLVPFGAWDNILVLLDRGARIDETGPRGQTAAYLFGALHQFDRVEVLLNRGADPTRADTNGVSLRDFVLQPVAPDSPQEPFRERIAARLGVPA